MTAPGDAVTAPGDALDELADLRADGWSVAVHNDYRVGGERYTFWLLVRDEVAIKGEGRTDREALAGVRARILARDRDEIVAAIAETAERVDHPTHYNTRGVECIDVVEHLPFSLGNCLKYLWRAGEKNDWLEDMRKALWYARRAEATVIGWDWDYAVGGDAIDLMDHVETQEGEALRTALSEIKRCVLSSPRPYDRSETRSTVYVNIRNAIEREIETGRARP